MINEYLFDAIMQEPKGENKRIAVNIAFLQGMEINVELLQSEDSTLYYQVPKDKLIENEKIEPSDILALRQCGWGLSQNKKYLRLYL